MYRCTTPLIRRWFTIGMGRLPWVVMKQLSTAMWEGDTTSYRQDLHGLAGARLVKQPCHICSVQRHMKQNMVVLHLLGDACNAKLELHRHFLNFTDPCLDLFFKETCSWLLCFTFSSSHFGRIK